MSADAPGFRADPRVDASLAGPPDWQRAVCADLRELIHAPDPEIEETIKRYGLGRRRMFQRLLEGKRRRRRARDSSLGEPYGSRCRRPR
jgi:hypothetical protein